MYITRVTSGRFSKTTVSTGSPQRGTTINVNVLTRARRRLGVFGRSVVAGVASAFGHSLVGRFAVRRTRLTLVVPDAVLVLARGTNCEKTEYARLVYVCIPYGGRAFTDRRRIRFIVYVHRTRAPRLRFVKLPSALIARYTFTGPAAAIITVPERGGENRIIDIHARA